MTFRQVQSSNRTDLSCSKAAEKAQSTIVIVARRHPALGQGANKSRIRLCAHVVWLGGFAGLLGTSPLHAYDTAHVAQDRDVIGVEGITPEHAVAEGNGAAWGSQGRDADRAVADQP